MLERFLGESYMPHGHCYFWEPGLVWLHLLSDVGVFLAYAAIPGFLALLLKRREDVRFEGIVWLFVAFIVLCGVTHLMGAVTIWHPYYGLEGVLKAVTALVSIATAVALYRALPTALAIPSPAALRTEVAQRTRTEAELRDQLARTDAILAALPDVVLELDQELRVLSVAGTTRSHVAEIEASAEAFASWEQDVIGELEPFLASDVTAGELVSKRFALRGPRGVELDYHARAVRKPDGGWVVSVEDETDQTRLIESLRASRELLEQFVYTASHDLRSPLRAVAQLSVWLEEDLGPKLEGENRENLHTLRARVQRMDDMLSGLLAFSRAGRARAEKEEVDLDALLHDIVEHEVDAEAAGRPVEGFSISADGPLPVVETVRAPLERVLANLVINAVKHHDRDEGRVLVRLDDSHPHELVIEVEDDGPGIPERHQERIFQLFQTLVPKDRKESTGMGLAIARRTVLSLGGSMEVESPVRDGRGTLFRVRWPRNARESIVPAALR